MRQLFIYASACPSVCLHILTESMEIAEDRFRARPQFSVTMSLTSTAGMDKGLPLHLPTSQDPESRAIWAFAGFEELLW